MGESPVVRRKPQHGRSAVLRSPFNETLQPMKTKLLLLLAAITAPVVFAQQPVPLPPLVSTSGTAEIQVVPDLADLQFNVEVRNADLGTARKEQAARAAKVLAALRAAGVAELELQSSQVFIEPDYTDRREETEKIKFYRVSQFICCTLHSVKKVPDVTSDAVAAGATGVGSASLRTSELRKHRDAARAKAIQLAKEKAVALAGALGAKVGKPYSIDDGAGPASNYNQPQIPQNAGNLAGAGEVPDDGTNPTFAAGTISVTATVRVSFILE